MMFSACLCIILCFCLVFVVLWAWKCLRCRFGWSDVIHVCPFSGGVGFCVAYATESLNIRLKV